VGLDFILKLRPVTYNFNIDRQNELMGITDSSDYKDKYDLEKIKMTGFLAQEVEKTAKEIGYDFSGVKIPKHDKELYGITYSEFVVPLVKGMQEQQVIIEHQQKEIDQLKMIVKRLIEKREE